MRCPSHRRDRLRVRTSIDCYARHPADGRAVRHAPLRHARSRNRTVHVNAPRLPGPPRAESRADDCPRRGQDACAVTHHRDVPQGACLRRGVRSALPIASVAGMRTGRRHPVARVRPARTTHRAGTRVGRTVTPQPPPSPDQRSVLAAHPLLLDRLARCRPLARPPSHLRDAHGQPRAAGARNRVRSHWPSQVSAPVPAL